MKRRETHQIKMKAKAVDNNIDPEKLVFCPGCGAQNRIRSKSRKKGGRYRCGECSTELSDPFHSKFSFPGTLSQKRAGTLALVILAILCVFIAASASRSTSQAKRNQAKAEAARDSANRELASMLDQRSGFEKSSNDRVVKAEDSKNEAQLELARMLVARSAFDTACQIALSKANQINEEAVNKMKSAEEIAKSAQEVKAVCANAFKEFGFEDARLTELLGAAASQAAKDDLVRQQARQHLPTDRRPTSNSIVKNVLSSDIYKSSLTMLNGLSEDAYVKIIKDNVCVASLYVRCNSNFTFSGIPDGTYRVMYCVGFGWNEKAQDFQRGRMATEYDNPLNYATRVVESDRQRTTYFDRISLTLNKTVNGNATTTDISPEAFDRF